MKTERIEASFDGAVAYLTLSRPPVNVIDFSMIDEIKTFLGSVREEPRLCALVLQGAGRVFSAGVDIPAHLPETVHAMIREVHSLFELLDDIAVPTIALARGRCLGGACELVGYFDYVIATEGASFGLPEIKLGVFPPAAAAFFPQRFGYQGVMRMLLTGDSIGPDEALRIGLASRVVAESEADAALEEALAPLRQRSAVALRLVKRASIRSRGASFRDLVELSEAVYLDELMATHDAVEGLQAFIDKREPVWTHQ